MIEKEIKKKYFEIRRIYIKDASFEAPNTPNIFSESWKPTIHLDFKTISTKVELNIFEVVLHVRVTVKSEDKLVFLCDVQQAGIFFITNLDKDMKKHCLCSYCPTILFPYVRECISNLVSHASFPQLNLEPINFDSIYYKNLELEKNNNKK
ncbi:protein-export chaperone SecB [Buchnera aphidicola]|uniref:protein-export chaperone SecB n=1 Tax=Buchnera aphidicola TaxID=9 RepID=UPI003BEEC790